MRVPHKDLRSFTASLLAAAGTTDDEAQIIADVLVWADLAGRNTQGVWRLTVMLPRLRDGLIRSPCAPEFSRQAEGIAVVDGHNGFGQYVGHVAMMKAIELARSRGIGMAAVRNSNHYSAGAYYANLAGSEGMIALALTNATRRVAAHGGISPVFGTNPISFGAPLRNGEPVLIDFSTGAMAGSVIRKAAEANQPIPGRVAIDEHGHSVTDPGKAQRATMLPFGGAKGYCLSLLVEILTGVVTGSLMSFQIPTMHEPKQTASRVGHFFLVIDIAKLLPLEEYHKRMEMVIAEVKHSARQPGIDEILIPGETRWRNYQAQLRDGVLLDSKTAASLASLASEYQLTPPW